MDLPVCSDIVPWSHTLDGLSWGLRSFWLEPVALPLEPVESTIMGVAS